MFIYSTAPPWPRLTLLPHTPPRPHLATSLSVSKHDQASQASSRSSVPPNTPPAPPAAPVPLLVLPEACCRPRLLADRSSDLLLPVADAACRPREEGGTCGAEGGGGGGDQGG